MKIHYASDLHLEFPGADNLIFPGGDLLLLAGDIIVSSYLPISCNRPTARSNFFKTLDREFSKYKKVISIMGNHEHYNGIIDYSRKILVDMTKMYPFYQVIENEIIDIAPGWKLFGSTFWTDYDAGDFFAMDAAKRGMGDHHLIEFADKRKFLPEDALQQNKRSRFELMKALEDNPEDNFIVMTHHTPSFKSCHPKFGGKNNYLNFAFSNTTIEEDIIKNYPNIKFWIHGHTHDSHDYMIDNCRVLCNPRGYVNYENHTGFSTEKYFEV